MPSWAWSIPQSHGSEVCIGPCFVHVKWLLTIRTTFCKKIQKRSWHRTGRATLGIIDSFAESQPLMSATLMTSFAFSKPISNSNAISEFQIWLQKYLILNYVFPLRAVESEILAILRIRHEDCVMFEGPDAKRKCADIYETYKQAEANWFCKCMLSTQQNSFEICEK